MQHVDRPPRQGDDLGRWERHRPGLGIDVAPDRGGRRDRAKTRHDLRAADVAGVDDVIDAREARLRFRSQQPMRVRDDADPHRFRHGDPSRWLSSEIVIVRHRELRQLQALNIMNLATPQSAIFSAIIFNALIIVALIPLALKGVRQHRLIGAGPLLRRNLLIYGVGGVIIPFIGIKLIDLVVTALHLA